MQNNDIIRREYNGAVIMQRADGSMNATAMCKACGKKWSHYFGNKETKAFLEELSTVAGIPATELVESQQGGMPSEQGTWVHKLVAYNLAQWLSPAFAVRVSMWLDDLHTTGHASLDPNGSQMGALSAIVQGMGALAATLPLIVSRLERLESREVSAYGPTFPIVGRLDDLLAIHEMKVKDGWKGRVVQLIMGECLRLQIQLTRHHKDGHVEMPASHLPWAESVMMRHIRQWRESNKTPMFEVLHA